MYVHCTLCKHAKIRGKGFNFGRPVGFAEKTAIRLTSAEQVDDEYHSNKRSEIRPCLPMFFENRFKKRRKIAK